MYVPAGGHSNVKTDSLATQNPIQQPLQPIEVPVIPLEEVRAATENFGPNAVIGIGSLGRVYLGNLKNGRHVAIKKLVASNPQDSDNEFLSQVLFSPIQLNGFLVLNNETMT